MKPNDRRRKLPEPHVIDEWNEGFLTTKTVHPIRCPVCGTTAEAQVITVNCLRGLQSHWLVMPAGWAMSLGMHFSEIRSLRTGLGRCPECIPKPKRARI